MPKKSPLTPEERIARINKQNAAYQKKNTRGITLRFSKKKDADVIAVLERQPSMTDYVRRLIRTVEEKR